MKIFRLEEANALLPTIRPLATALAQGRRDLAIGLLEVDAASRMHPGGAGSTRAATLAQRARDHQARILTLVDEISGHGCIVKDLDLGLIDFPALRGGQVVNLCWKIDEPVIAFWHTMEEGFAQRKSLARRRKSTD